MIRLFLADDHPSILDGLVAKFDTEKDILVIGTATSKKELLEKLQLYHSKLDLLILDLNLGDSNIIPLIQTIRNNFPSLKIVCYTSYGMPNLVKKVLAEGVMGYVVKEKGSMTLLKAIQQVMNGKVFKSLQEESKSEEEIFGIDSDFIQHNKLSKRELEILRWVANGFSNKQVAEILSIDETTVKTHRRNIKRKLDAPSTADLVKIAARLGLLD